MKAGISLYYNFSKRKGIKLVQYIGWEVREGNNPMTLQVYKYLAKMIYESDKKEHIFSRLFLILD